MLTPEEAASRLRRLIEERYSGCVLFATLFGSVAKGRAGPLSDVDVAVKLASGCERLEFLISFSVDASEVLEIDDVDVLILTDDLPYELRYRAASGRLIYARNREAYVDEVVTSFSLWADLQIHLARTKARERFAESLWAK